MRRRFSYLSSGGAQRDLFLFFLVLSFFGYGQTDSVKAVPDSAAIGVEEYNAEFPGGNEELIKYISSSLKKTMRKAKKAKAEGTVYARFIVEKDGSVSNVLLEQSLENCNACNEEILKVIRNMPIWTPARNADGEPVRQKFRLPIRFFL